MNLFEISSVVVASAVLCIFFILLCYVVFDFLNEHYYLRSRVKQFIRRHTDKTLMILHTKEADTFAHVTRYEIQIWIKGEFEYRMNFDDLVWHQHIFEPSIFNLLLNIHNSNKNQLVKILFRSFL